LEEEEEPRTSSQWASKEGKYEDNMENGCCGSNNHIIIKLWHQEE
jgi:hypothetical protein